MHVRRGGCRQFDFQNVEHVQLFDVCAALCRGMFGSNIARMTDGDAAFERQMINDVNGLVHETISQNRLATELNVPELNTPEFVKMHEHFLNVTSGRVRQAKFKAAGAVRSCNQAEMNKSFADLDKFCTAFKTSCIGYRNALAVALPNVGQGNDHDDDDDGPGPSSKPVQKPVQKPLKSLDYTCMDTSLASTTSNKRRREEEDDEDEEEEPRARTPTPPPRKRRPRRRDDHDDPPPPAPTHAKRVSSTTFTRGS
ncbi:uncharacterized protein LOC117645269 [Thrips palmi]|uniref:Uncharacterized protein LOC117645269 n=1 Tax=Thrips palmi TaxID=161013 RepID=A0A6P8Z3Q1_THRPL|nr:uncharacterized protein LOC117645269 [Thrips palmi]